MPEYLQTTIDKFTFRVAKDRLYTPDGVWVFWLQPEGPNRVRVGLTDFRQQHSGDAAFVHVKPVGARLQAGDDFAELETIKVNLILPSPVAGAILEVNEALELNPEIVNRDPYDKGWLAVIETANWEADRTKLLDASAYFSVMQSQVEEELKQP
jgi:glycine cleavage system H protein